MKKSKSKKDLRASVADKKLFARLRQLRKQIADREEMPPYIIFSDVSLAEMSELMPINENISDVYGDNSGDNVSEKKKSI